MREWMNIVNKLVGAETEILAIMKLGEYFKAERAVIADTRDHSVRYYVPVDAPAPTDEDVEAVRQLDADGNADGILELLLARGILKRL